MNYINVSAINKAISDASHSLALGSEELSTYVLRGMAYSLRMAASRDKTDAEMAIADLEYAAKRGYKENNINLMLAKLYELRELL